MSGLIANTSYPYKTIVSSSNYNPVYYLDLNVDYGLNSQQFQVQNIDAINTEIINLISTSPGEVPFEPLFGSNVLTLLFERANTDLAFAVINDSYEAFERWIPEIVLNKQACVVSALDSTLTGFYIRYAYTIRGLTGPASASLSINK